MAPREGPEFVPKRPFLCGVRQALREGVAQSTSVVEDDPDGFSHSEADSANAVTQVDAIVALP